MVTGWYKPVVLVGNFSFLFLFQVCLCDISDETGQRIRQELAKNYSEDSVVFLKCDVTSKQQFEGLTISACEWSCLKCTY